MERNAFVIRRTNDDLQHWKYIRREPNYNGRGYKYYYAETTAKDAGKSRLKDMLGYDERSAYNTMKNTYELHNTLSVAGKRAARQATIDMRIHGTNKPSTNKSLYKIGRDFEISNRVERDQTVSVMRQALKEYEKTPLYKLEKMKNTINKGKNAVKRLLGIN